MQNERQQTSFITIGSSSLLVVFLSLCLVTFAVLALSGAHSDYTFSEKLGQRQKAYYEASNQAEEALRLLDECMETGGFRLSNLAGLQEQAAAQGLGLEFESPREGILSIQVPIDESQELHVVLAVEEGSSAYEIRAWQTITDKSWEAEEHIELLPLGE